LNKLDGKTSNSLTVSQARAQFDHLASNIEKQFDSVAGTVRNGISKIQSPHFVPPPPPPPPTSLQLVQRWISKNRAISAAIVAFIVTGSVSAVVYSQTRNTKRKRRARKSRSGARTDVVVVAGAVANPLTSAVYLDLERRGFVVYVISHGSDDERYIRSQSRADLIPLPFDIRDPFAAQEQTLRFQELLARDHFAYDGADAHRLHLAGLILVPDTQHAAARIEDITLEEWSDALHAKLLPTINTTTQLLPSITLHNSKILLLTPSVTPALRLPSHSIQTVLSSALTSFLSSLSAELAPSTASISHFKLGDIDIPSVTARQRREGIASPSRFKPTPIRQLHNAVFDALVAPRPSRVYHIGRGSLTYDVIGKWVPPAWIAWMMGAKSSAAQETRRNILDDDDVLRTSHSSDVMGSLTWEKIDDDSDHSHEDTRTTFEAAA
jgi:hypothetical protein